jgi:DNA-binding transcriptional LysR family regulator
VQHGLGIAIIPDYLVQDSNTLVQLMPEAELPEFETYFVYPSELRDSARVSAFRDFLIGNARTWKF